MAVKRMYEMNQRVKENIIKKREERVLEEIGSMRKIPKIDNKSKKLATSKS